MTEIDWLVVLILLCSIVISLLRGLVKEVLSLVAWVVAFVLANAYGETVAQWLPGSLPGQLVRMMVGFAAVLILVLLLGALVNKVLGALIQAGGLSFADRGLGGLFGLARGVVIVLILALFAGMTELPKQPIWRNALLTPLIETSMHTLKPWLPNTVAKRISF
ncbi:MAG: CvpA family protein [Burkholderiaceae bacterium]|nr:MAG: CvpA family protein [Burkholderiaceae bacterium]